MTGAQEFEKCPRRQRQERRLLRARERLADRARAAFSALEPAAGAADRAGAVGRHLRRSSSADEFFSSFALTLILQQVAIVGIVGAAQTLVILTAGIDLSVGAIMVLGSVVMGKFASPTACRRRSHRRRACRRRPVRLAQRLARRPHEAAALHRDARHLADRPGDELHLFRQRDDPQPGHRRPRRRCCILRPRASSSAARASPRRHLHGAARRCCSGTCCNHTAWGRHVYAVGDDPEAAELSGIHDQEGADLGLCAVGPHLRASPAGS